MNREELGKVVREAWLKWLASSPSVSGQRPASWSAEWDDLKEEDKEVDRQIGEAVQKALIDRHIAKEAEEKKRLGDLLWNEGVLADRPRRGYIAIPIKTYTEILDSVIGKSRKGGILEYKAVAELSTEKEASTKGEDEG